MFDVDWYLFNHFAGDPQFLEIDPFLLTPGPHILSVSFNLTNGAEGIFAYNFTAEERPGT